MAMRIKIRLGLAVGMDGGTEAGMGMGMGTRMGIRMGPAPVTLLMHHSQIPARYQPGEPPLPPLADPSCLHSTLHSCC